MSGCMYEQVLGACLAFSKNSVTVQRHCSACDCHLLMSPKHSKWKKVRVAQSCPTFCDPMDCSPPGSSVHGILQTRILEWVASPFSRESSRPRDRTWASRIAGRFFTVWVTREAQSYVQVGCKKAKLCPDTPILCRIPSQGPLWAEHCEGGTRAGRDLCLEKILILKEGGSDTNTSDTWLLTAHPVPKEQTDQRHRGWRLEFGTKIPELGIKR